MPLAKIADPKRPEAVVKFRMPPGLKDPSDDVSNILAMILGSAGLVLKMRMLSWGALIVAATTWMNTRLSAPTSNMLTSGFSFAMMGIVTTYMPLFFNQAPILDESDLN
ncbi:hypothetical protein BJ742DRAFT_816752 [Cladochytrium replicatum]|nr:hypothetical protein BJ742DRAFT_816752 [Cladochytrium replicatum]